MLAAGSHRNLAWLAGACFVAGWFLPAAPEVPGWMAFRYALAPVWPYGSGSAEGIEDVVPQVLSALTNVVFALMFVTWLRARLSQPVLFLKIAIACLLLNCYWLVQMLRAGKASGLLVGYYVWLAAFALLVALAACLVLPRKPRS